MQQFAQSAEKANSSSRSFRFSLGLIRFFARIADSGDFPLLAGAVFLSGLWFVWSAKFVDGQMNLIIGSGLLTFSAIGLPLYLYARDQRQFLWERYAPAIGVSGETDALRDLMMHRRLTLARQGEGYWFAKTEGGYEVFLSCPMPEAGQLAETFEPGSLLRVTVLEDFGDHMEIRFKAPDL